MSVQGLETGGYIDMHIDWETVFCGYLGEHERNTKVSDKIWIYKERRKNFQKVLSASFL